MPTEDPEAVPEQACSGGRLGRAEAAEAAEAADRGFLFFSGTSEFEVLTFPCICITGRFLKVFRKL